MNTPSIDAELDRILEQFSWYVPPNDFKKWESFSKRKGQVKAALTRLLVEQLINELKVWEQAYAQGSIHKSSFAYRIATLKTQLINMESKE